MEFTNLLAAKNRDELRKWLADNHDKEKECWVIVKRGRPVDDGTFWYIDAVEEALKAESIVWENFQKFPSLYQRVRIDTIQIKKKQPELFQSRLQKLTILFLSYTFSTISPYYQRYPKRKKERPTSHFGEPLQAQNSLILLHFSILSPNRSKIPMASI